MWRYIASIRSRRTWEYRPHQDVRTHVHTRRVLSRHSFENADFAQDGARVGDTRTYARVHSLLVRCGVGAGTDLVPSQLHPERNIVRVQLGIQQDRHHHHYVHHSGRVRVLSLFSLPRSLSISLSLSLSLPLSLSLSRSPS